MINRIFDTTALSNLAGSICRQAGLVIGIYDTEGREIFLSEPNSFLDSEIKGAISRLGAMSVENVIDTPVMAVAMRGAEGELFGVWTVRPKDAASVSNMDRHLGLIEAATSAYFKERQVAVELSGAVEEFEKAGEDLTKELRQNEVITEILGKVESEDDFDRVVREILVLSGEFLALSNAFILQIDEKEGTASMLTEWRGPDSESLVNRFEEIAIADLPFADGLSYTVSSDSRMPDVFRNFMRTYDISAGVFLPVFLNEVNVMYLCATMEKAPRHWRLSDVGFLNDVKRVITTILAKRITKNSLASSYAVVESVLENTGCGICVISMEDGSLLYSNESFRTMFSDLSDKQRFERRMKQTPDKMTQIREYQIENAGIFVSITLGTIHWVDDSAVRLCTLFDITENKEFEKRIEKQANTDELTGIYNRIYFNKELGALLSKPHSPGAVISMNIDGFKDVNISAGSEAGDSILSSVAKFLLKMSGDNVRVYRIGADEFSLIIKDVSVTNPKAVAESIVKRFDAPWQLPYADCYLTVSVGVAQFPQDGDDLYTIVNSCNIALSEAKRSAACIEYYDGVMDAAERERIKVKALLRDEVTGGCKHIEVHKRPCAFVFERDDIRDGFLTSMTWVSDEIGTKGHGEILGISKRQQIDLDVIRHFIDESTGALRDQNDFGYPEHCLGIPVDAGDLVRAGISEMVKASTESFNATTRNLVICLVGYWPADEHLRALEVCRKIRALGVHIVSSLADTPEDLLELADVKGIC